VVRSIDFLIVKVLIRSYAQGVVMPTMNIDVLMVAACDMSMRMAQGCQQEADTRNETEHAHKRGHRGGV
jgi:hypothetical protein